MSVSSIGGSSTSALYFQRLAANQSNSSSSSYSAQQAPPQGAPPGPPPGGEGEGPPGFSELPEGLQTSLQSLFEENQGTTSPDEMKEKVTTAINEFKETDEYAALSDDEKSAIEEFAEGPKRREEQGRSGVMSQLDQLGSSTRASIFAQFGSSSTSTTSTDLASLLSQLESATA